MDYTLLFHNLWLWSTMLFCIVQYIKWSNGISNSILYTQREANGMVIYIIIFSLLMGFRMNFNGHWADSYLYVKLYEQVATTTSPVFQEDWLYDKLQHFFATTGFSVDIWFTFCCLLYLGCMYVAVRRLKLCNEWIAMLFCLSAFSFFVCTYNGVRNGMACSIVLLAISYLLDKTRRGFIISMIISVMAIGVHKSTALPVLSMYCAFFLKKDFKWALAWWGLSIVLSLTVGNTIAGFVASLGFDDRLAGYVGTNVADSEFAELFSHTGFRWDFVLYSVMPIYLAYIVIIKREIYDKLYIILINTYIFSNSFWIMVINSLNSNRFAYLSWFMYPIVIAYPLLKLEIWPDQNKKVVQILMLHIGFTFFMDVVYYGII